MHVINTEYFGKVMIPLDRHYSLKEEKEQFDHVKLEAMGESGIYSFVHTTKWS